MSGLFGALSNGVKALTAHSSAIETSGRNLANVNNANYARQRIVYGDRGTVQTKLGAQSLGLEAKSVQQLRDILLDRQVEAPAKLGQVGGPPEDGHPRAPAPEGALDL